MQLLDYIILALLVLGGLIGFIRGAKKKIKSLAVTIAGFSVAILCYQMLSNLILTTNNFGNTWSEFWANKFIDGASSNEVSIFLQMPYSEFTNDIDSLKNIYVECGVPKFLASFFISKVFINTSTVAVAMGSSFVASITYAVTFIILFIIAGLVAGLIVNFLFNLFKSEKAKQEGKKGIFDRLLGLIYGVFKSGCSIVIIMLVMVLIGSFVPQMNTWLQNQVGFHEDFVTISKTFYNWAYFIINLFM